MIKTKVARTLWIVGIICIGCSEGTWTSSANNATELLASKPNASEPVVYPRGRWRLASPATLERSVVWLSLLLIRHADAEAQLPGTLFPWAISGAGGSRSRVDALERASALAALLRENPDRFADLARQESEDPTTRAVGGALGGVRVSELEDDPMLLDAVAALKPGEVSGVVDSRSGFIIVSRHSPPVERTVSGRHIVIARNETPWMRLFAANIPQRTSADAMALAQAIYTQALGQPEAFTSLVTKYSEHPDRANFGDLGTWTTHEPTPYPRALAALETLDVGEISPPVETHLGIEVLQRTPNVAREELAMEAIELAFDFSDAASKSKMVALAQQMIDEIREQPRRFEELRHEYCCTRPVRWVSGRDEPRLTAAVRSLQVGEVAREPVVQYTSIVIPRRLAPEAVPAPPAVVLDVPAPEKVELNHLVGVMPQWMIVRELFAVVELRRELAATQKQEQLLLRLAKVTKDSHVTLPTSDVIEALNSLFALDPSGELSIQFHRRIGQKILGSKKVLLGSR